MPKAIDLLRLAKQLRMNSEEPAWTIEILAALHDCLGTLLLPEDVQTSKYTDAKFLEFTETFSKANGCPKALVRNVLDKFFRLDTRDYSEFYAACIRTYQDSEYPDSFLEEQIEALSTVSRAKCRAFVLHKSINALNSVTGELYILGTEDAEFGRIMKGYLVSKGLAYQSVVELLSSSMEESWPEAEVLWKKM